MGTKRDGSAITTNGSANPFKIPKKSKQEVEPAKFRIPKIKKQVVEETAAVEIEQTEFELLVQQLEIDTSDIQEVLERILEYPWTDAPPESVAPRCVGFDY